jgi:hypothetical protein
MGGRVGLPPRQLLRKSRLDSQVPEIQDFSLKVPEAVA